MGREMETRICSRCGETVGAKEFCPTCISAWEKRSEAHTLTPDERESEMRRLGETMEIPFTNIHQRIEELVGRPVWTHEMGLNWDGLCAEARWENRPSTMQEIVELIPEEKRIVVGL